VYPPLTFVQKACRETPSTTAALTKQFPVFTSYGAAAPARSGRRQGRQLWQHRAVQDESPQQQPGILPPPA